MRRLDQALARLHNYVREKQLFPAGAKLLLCCSGGADSVAMLQLFSRLRSLMHVTLLAVHIDHQLRGAEDEADTELVKALCQKLNIPLIVRKVKLQGASDLENQARKQRREVFGQLLELYRLDHIVTAHHNNDQAETMLLNLFRGAGLSGLAGIKPRSGDTLHPMLCFNKRELEQMLEEEGIGWREDPSNQQQNFRRNWIRHTLLPLAASQLNPQIADKLGLQAQIFEEAEQIVLQKIKPLLKKCLIESSPEQAVLDVGALERCSRLEQYYILKNVVSELSGSSQDFFHHNFEDLRGLLGSDGSRELNLGSGLRARRQYRRLILAQSAKDNPVPEPYTVEEDRSRAVWGEYRFSFKILRVKPGYHTADPLCAYLDADKVRWPITIRGRRPGDRFQPLGLEHSQKLKEFFINAKLPRFERDSVPVLEDGEKILWIAGHRLDARAAIDDSSTRFLHISAERVDTKPMRAANRVKKPGEINGPDEL